MRATAKKKASGVDDQSEFVTPTEFARLFKIGRSTVQGMIDSGAIKTVKLPTADPNAKKQIRRIPQSEVDRVRKSLSGR